MLGQTSGVTAPQRKKEKGNINICPQTLNFRGTAARSPDFSPLDSYLWRRLKTLVYSAAIENEERL
jgi:hypothetical protein